MEIQNNQPIISLNINRHFVKLNIVITYSFKFPLIQDIKYLK